MNWYLAPKIWEKRTGLKGASSKLILIISASSGDWVSNWYPARLLFRFFRFKVLFEICKPRKKTSLQLMTLKKCKI